MNTHVERARQIADALESQDVEQTLHEQFVAEWKAWEAEDPTRTMADFDRAIGRVNAKGQPTEYTSQLVRLVTAPSARSEKRDRTDRAATRKVLADPEQRQRVIESLPPEVKCEIVENLAKDPETEHVVRREAERGVQKEYNERVERGYERVESERRERKDLRFIELDDEIARAKLATDRVLRLAREIEWTDEHRELVDADVADVLAAWQMIQMALAGESDIDWDAGLARLS